MATTETPTQKEKEVSSQATPATEKSTPAADTTPASAGKKKKNQQTAGKKKAIATKDKHPAKKKTVGPPPEKRVRGTDGKEKGKEKDKSGDVAASVTKKKKKGKKGMSEGHTRRNIRFGCYIRKIMHAKHPDMRITSSAVDCLASYSRWFVDTLTYHTSRAARYRGVKTLRTYEVIVGIQSMYPEDEDDTIVHRLRAAGERAVCLSAPKGE